MNDTEGCSVGKRGCGKDARGSEDESSMKFSTKTTEGTSKKERPSICHRPAPTMPKEMRGNKKEEK